jgi:plasmid maintenance system antidote protein VapI
MSTVHLNELVRGKRGVTADTALRLAQIFKTDAVVLDAHASQLHPENGDGSAAALKLAKRA